MNDKEVKTEMTREQANLLINELTTNARALITEAESIAKIHAIEFSFDVEYGMGGTFGPDHWSSSEDQKDTSNWRWISSSEQC